MSTSQPIAHHLTTRLEKDRPLAPGPRERRILVRVLLEAGRGAGLLAFCVADTHLHVLLALARAEAMELMRRIEIAAQHRLRLGSHFETARPKPIENLWHLDRALSYIHKQEERHGLAGFDSGEATSLPDLLEMRPLGSYLIKRVRRALPRLTRDALLDQAGLQSLEPTCGPPSLVIEAACRAAALPDLCGTKRETIAARRAALELFRHQLHLPEAGRLLGMSRTATYRLAGRPVDSRLLRALGLQLHWLQSRGSANTQRPWPVAHPPGA